MCGLRIQLTNTSSAVGTIVPIFISVLGLNDHELPNEYFIKKKIKWLCVG